MKTRIRSIAAFVILAAAVACTGNQFLNAGKVSIDLYTGLAAIQDAENALYASNNPKWDLDKHQRFNAEMGKALRAGRAFNKAVLALPMTPDQKLDFTTVSTALSAANAIFRESGLGGDTPVGLAISAAIDGVLKVLPHFLK